MNFHPVDLALMGLRLAFIEISMVFVIMMEEIVDRFHVVVDL